MITLHEVNLCIDKLIEESSDIVEKSLIKENINLIRNSDGKINNLCECCEPGSYIYFLFDDLDNIIYIGESGESIRHSLFTDGNELHYKKNWFCTVKYLKYFKDDKMGANVRKVLERVLITKHSPIYNK